MQDEHIDLLLVLLTTVSSWTLAQPLDRDMTHQCTCCSSPHIASADQVDIATSIVKLAGYSAYTFRALLTRCHIEYATCSVRLVQLIACKARFDPKSAFKGWNIS